MAKTNAGGTINCVDAGAFGNPTIDKAITIDWDGSNGQVQSASGVTINAGANDVVHLRGLMI